MAARTRNGVLFGFVNIALDGGDHAILLDTKTRGDWQRRGVATEIVSRAAKHATTAGASGSTSTLTPTFVLSTSISGEDHELVVAEQLRKPIPVVHDRKTDSRRGVSINEAERDTEAMCG